MLSQKIKFLIRDVYESRAIWKSAGLTPAVRRKIISSALRIDLLAALPNPVSLAGFIVSYQNDNHLRYLFREIFIQGDYCFLAGRTNPLIVDCGSNIGVSILFFKMLYPEARIIGFEPDPDTFKTLQQNVRQNALKDVDLNCCALADRDGTIGFHRSAHEKGSLMMSIVPERIDGERIEVLCRRLSAFIEQEVDLLKMDVEGAEQLVLRELAGSGKLRRVKQMHLEYHHHILPQVDNLSDTLRLLEEQGFGYQMRARSPIWPAAGQFQDVSIYCYRKNE